MSPVKPVPNCDACARVTRALRRVRVRPSRGGEVRTLNLCQGCLTHMDATWRLQWREEP